MTKEAIWKAIEAYRQSGWREEHWRNRDALDVLLDEQAAEIELMKMRCIEMAQPENNGAFEIQRLKAEQARTAMKADVKLPEPEVRGWDRLDFAIEGYTAEQLQQAVAAERAKLDLLRAQLEAHVPLAVAAATRITDFEAALLQCIDALERCTKYEQADYDAITNAREALK